MASWAQRTIGSQVVDSLTASKITTGTLNAATTIHVGDPAGVHTQIGQGAVRIMRPDSDGEIVPTISMGGVGRDVVQIVDPDSGATLAGINDDGSVVGQEVIADTITVGGSKIGNPYDPDDLLWQFARGSVGYQMTAPSAIAAQTRLGVAEASTQVQGGRLYKVVFSATLANLGTDGDPSSYVHIYRTLDGSSPNISVSSQVLYGTTWVFPGRTAAAMPTITTAYINVGADPGLWYTLRVMATISRRNSGRVQVSYGSTWPGYLIIEDCGPQGNAFLRQGQVNSGGGTPAGSTTPTPPPETEARKRVSTYNASWSRTFRASGEIRTDVGTDMVQGRPALAGQTNNYAMIGFPSQVQTDLAGSTISKIEVYLWAYHWWGATGAAVIGVHTQSSAPAAFSYSGMNISSNWKRGEGRWVTLPAEWHAGFLSGLSKGITLGGNTGSSTTFYGRMYGYGHPRCPQLRVTYTK